MNLKDDFAATLKKARRSAGLSQAQLAGRAGLTGSYVCVLESRRKPPPSPDVVGALARALGIDEARLQELAALERSPEPVRRRVLRLVRERGRVRRTRDTLLTTTLFHVTRRPGFLAGQIAEALGLPEDRKLLLGRLADRIREMPTAKEAVERQGDLLREVPGRDRDALVRVLPSLIAGSAAPEAGSLAAGSLAAQPAPHPLEATPERLEHEEKTWRHVPVHASLPAGAHAGPGIDTFHLDRRLYRPGAFLLVADDDEAFPRVEPGDLLLVCPNEVPSEGDLVVVRDGERARVRILHRQTGTVRLDSPRADVPPLRVPEARFVAAGVVTWIVRPLRGLPPPRAGHAREGPSGAESA